MHHTTPVQSCRRVLPAAAIAGLLLLAACQSGDKTLLEVDPKAVPADPSYDMVVGILDRSCVPCHKGGGGGVSPAEDGEENPHYDTCNGILRGLEGLVRTGIENESMPPGAWPRFTEPEKLIIRRWIDNGACAPCNPCP